MSNTAMIMGQAAAPNSEVPGSWDLSYAYYDDPFAWDISTTVYTGDNFLLSGQDTTPLGIFFKPDGTKMYMAGQFGDSVHEYNLSIPWRITTSTYSQSFNIPYDSQLSSVFFKDDGTIMYVTGTASDSVHQYALSTAWDISTASFVQSFSVGSEDNLPYFLYISPDGTKLYISGDGGNNIYEYTLSTPWDISTTTYVQSLSVSGQDTSVFGISFKPDGTKMYMVGGLGDDVNEYTLSTPWDISTASFVTSFSVGAQDTSPYGLYVKPDGSTFYFVGLVSRKVFSYTLGGFSVQAQEGNPSSVFFKPDGTRMYILGYSGDDINQYDLSTPWNLATATYLNTFSVSAQETTPSGLYIKPDGTKMYVTGSTGDDVNQYALSTPWDVTTATYETRYDASTQETVPQAVSFNSTGTKMYLMGSTGDDINEYTLTTPWEIGVGVGGGLVKSVSTEDTVPVGLFFKPDGTKMFMAGQASVSLHEYSLSNAFNILTVSYVQSLALNGFAATLTDLFISPDGTKLFYLCMSRDRVYTFSMVNNQ